MPSEAAVFIVSDAMIARGDRPRLRTQQVSMRRDFMVDPTTTGLAGLALPMRSPPPNRSARPMKARAFHTYP